MENTTQDSKDDGTLDKRSIFARICFTLLWFLPVIFIINVLVGGIVGGFAPTGGTFQEGYVSGAEASKAFFQQYGQIVFGIELLIWLGMSFFGILPGTAKYKKKKA